MVIKSIQKKIIFCKKELIGKLNSFYKDTDPLIYIFDPACLVYTRKTNCKYILDNIQWTKTFKSYLTKHNFDLVLASRLLGLFELVHYKQSFFQYINISNHIYYKALIVDLKNKKDFLETKDLNLAAVPANIKIWNPKDKPQQLNKNHPYIDINFNQENKESLDLKNQSTKKKPLKVEITGQDKISIGKDFLSGKKLLQHLLLSLETKTPEESRKYSYFFLDSHNKPIKKVMNCYKKREQILILQQGCPYSKKEFKTGVILIEKEKIALFYLPFPTNLSEKLSLRALFRFDLF